MTYEDFKKSIQLDQPPVGLDLLLKALWYDAKGDWEKSHNIVQDIETKDAALIHAYLHRKEEDIGNADYWYRQAGKKRPEYSLENEWEKILKSFLDE